MADGVRTSNVRQGTGQEEAAPRTAATCAQRPDAPAAVEPDVTYPGVGDWLCECKLLAELGSGVQGRIFLASQPLLCERLVVLKVTPCAGSEHLNLAQLLHTHIVPLLFAQDLPERRLRVLAMPYLGGAPLGAVLARLRARLERPRTGQDLLAALDAVQGPAMYRVPTLRARLASMPFVSAVCWL